MKYLAILIFALLFLTSCNNNNEDEIFELNYEVEIFYEAGINQFEAHYIDNFGINTRIDELLAASGRTREDVGKILPKSADLVNVRTDVGIDFIRNLSLRVFDGSPLDPEAKENETEIFFRDNVPQDRSSLIDLLPSLPDVKDFLLEDKFNFLIRTELRAPPPNTVELRLRLRFTAQ